MLIQKMQIVEDWAAKASPVFIVGLPRSGTSVTAVALGRHPDFIKIGDFVAETRIFRRPPSEMLRERAGAARRYLGNLRNEYAEFVRSGDEKDEAFVRMTRILFFYLAAQHAGGKRIFEKTPAHLLSVGEISGVFPNAQFVVCMRDPVEIFASYRKRLKRDSATKPKDDPSLKWLRISAERFADVVDRYFTCIADEWGRIGGRTMLASYRSLVGDSIAQLRRICEFLQIAYAETMVGGDSSRGGTPAGPIQSSGTEAEIGQWVTEGEVSLIRRRCEELLKRIERPDFKEYF